MIKVQRDKMNYLSVKAICIDIETYFFSAQVRKLPVNYYKIMMTVEIFIFKNITIMRLVHKKTVKTNA